MNTKPIQHQKWAYNKERVRVVVTTTPEEYKRVHMPDVLWSIKKIEYCVNAMMKRATTANSEH